MKYLMGLDIGTTNIKGVLTSIDGKKLYEDKAPFYYEETSDGKVEIEAEAYIEICAGVIKKLADKLSREDTILGLSTASASGNLLLLDKNDEPITPIFNWRDTRTQNEAQFVLNKLGDDEIYETVGWRFDGKTFPIAHFCWLKKHESEKVKNAGKICMSTEYLFYKLTGKWGISTSTGTPFYFIDQKRGEYNKELLELLDVDEALLPPIMDEGTILGQVTSSGEEAFGIKEGTNVILGTFDHPSAARATGVFEEGEMLLSCGTSWVGFCPIKDRQTGIDNNLIVDPFLSKKGNWGAMFSLTAVSVRIEKFIRKHICDTKDIYAEFERLARKSSLGAGGIAIDLYKDYDVEELRKYPKKNLARAIMESVVRLLDEKLDLIRQNGINPSFAIMTGGPTQNRLWIDVIEEMLHIKIEIKHGSYAGAIGAAMLAGIGSGIYKDEREAYKIIECKIQQGG